MNYLNIKEENILPVVVELNKLLADYHIYYQKLRNFHWNVSGENFFDLHEQFEELYNDAKIKIDEIAERVLTLRYHPISNLSESINGVFVIKVFSHIFVVAKEKPLEITSVGLKSLISFTIPL